jgi:simple sugar transport system permease protein
MTATVERPKQPPAPQPARDERVANVGILRKLLVKPEFGALVGAIVIFVFFSVATDVFLSLDGVANWLDIASTLGLMAVPVALLMIGGHFDLSAGVQVGTAGLATGIMTTYWGLNVYASLFVSLLLMLAIGFVNGFLVTRTGLPSFIITLGMFLALQGVNLGVTKLVTNTVQVENLDLVPGYRALKDIFGSTFGIGGADFQIAIVWWIVFTIIGSWLLLKTRFGNWIFATGGDANASKNVGVPTGPTTIALFMLTSFMAWFAGNTVIIRFGTIQAQVGIGQELYYIVAAVIGGCLLTGGYGSVVGASLGALIFGMTQAGIVYADWNSDWFKTFVGAMLLLAVLANQYVRRIAEQSRRR